MYRGCYFPDPLLQWVFIDQDQWNFELCPECRETSLLISNNFRKICPVCFYNQPFDPLEMEETDYARGLIESSQYLLLNDYNVSSLVIKNLKEAEKILLQHQKEKDLKIEKLLADLYAALVIAYELQFEEEGLDEDEMSSLVYDAVFEHYDRRRILLKEEPSTLNYFLFGAALYDLGTISSEYADTEWKEEIEAATDAVEYAIKRAIRENNTEFIPVIARRLIEQLFELGVEAWAEKNWVKAGDILEAYMIWAQPVLYESDGKNRILYDQIAEVYEMMIDVNSSLEDYDEGIEVIREAIDWMKGILHKEVRDLEYWKGQQPCDWDELYWKRLNDLRILYEGLFYLYVSNDQPLKAASLLEEMAGVMEEEDILILQSEQQFQNDYSFEYGVIETYVAEHFQELNDFKRSENFYLEALAHFQKSQERVYDLKTLFNLQEVWNGLREVYEELNQPEKARQARQKWQALNEERKKFREPKKPAKPSDLEK